MPPSLVHHLIFEQACLLISSSLGEKISAKQLHWCLMLSSESLPCWTYDDNLPDHATTIKTYEMPTPGPKNDPIFVQSTSETSKFHGSSDAFSFTWDPANQAWICFTFFNRFCTALASPPAKGSPQATTSPLLVRAAKAACVAWMFSTSFLRQAPWMQRGIGWSSSWTSLSNGPCQSKKYHVIIIPQLTHH